MYAARDSYYYYYYYYYTVGKATLVTLIKNNGIAGFVIFPPNKAYITALLRKIFITTFINGTLIFGQYVCVNFNLKF